MDFIKKTTFIKNFLYCEEVVSLLLPFDLLGRAQFSFWIDKTILELLGETQS
jgi:hypothetical protein